MTYSALILCKLAVSVVSALGLYLCATLCGRLSLGSAGFMAIGAYLFACLGVGAGGFALCLVFAISYLSGLVIMRLSGDCLAAVTLGIAELVRITLSNLTLLGGAGGMTVSDRIGAFGALAAAVACWGFTELFAKSKTGLLVRAVGIDETAASACRVKTRALKATAFALCATLCALAGGIYAAAVGFVCPSDFSFTRSCETLAAVLLGGKSPLAVAVSAAALELLSTLLQGVAELKLIIYGAVLLGCVLVRRRKNA